jgi:hypothetical protein
MAIFLGEVGAVADDKVADRQADEIDRDLDLALLWLIEQRACREAGDFAPAQFSDGTAMDRLVSSMSSTSSTPRLAAPAGTSPISCTAPLLCLPRP